MLANATVTINELISDSLKEMSEANLRRKYSVSKMKDAVAYLRLRRAFGKGKVR
jgi:hypothetical protein